MTAPLQPPTPPRPEWIEPGEYVDTIENATLYACLLFTDEQGRLFLLHTARPEHGQIWQCPGGNVEKDATPWDTARQECREETGLEFDGPPVLLAVHYLKPSDAWPRGKTGFVFDGGTLTAEQLASVRVDPREHTHWEARTLEEWRAVLSPRLFALLSGWLQARAGGTPRYVCADDRPGRDGGYAEPGARGEDGVPGGVRGEGGVRGGHGGQGEHAGRDESVDSGATARASARVAEPEVGAEVAAFLAAQPAPLAAAKALILDGHGRILLVDPVYKDGWDLPGGMLEDEGPAVALTRELHEEIGLDKVEVGRLLAVDTVPASVNGRTLVAFVYGVRPAEPVDPGALSLQRTELRAAGFYPPEEALTMVPARLARRLSAALAARRGSHTAVLADGVQVPVAKPDYYAMLPAPMMAATVVVTRTDGRVLVLQPSYKQHAELPGGMVESHESPAEGAARELCEELGLVRDVGRVLAVDTSSAAETRHGRALSTFVFALDPMAPEEAEAMVLGDEVASVRWETREQARRALPWRLAARMDAALDARAAGTTVHLTYGRPDIPASVTGWG